jgi:hypothetical protein
MYLMLGTHPNIAYAVAILGRHTATPGEDRQHALDHVFQYLRATSDWQLVFQRGEPGGTELHTYIDADWAGNVND